MKRKTGIFLIIMLGINVLSCTERIDLKLDEGSIRLVVEGSVTTDTMVHRVILSKTTSYYFSQEAPSVTGASVSIRTSDRTIQLLEMTAGVYETDSAFYGIAGENYTLEIHLQDAIAGNTEYTATTVMNAPVKIDSLRLIFHPDWSDDGFWEVRCFFQDPPTDDYYRYLVLKNGRLLTDTLDKWFVTDDRFFNGAYVSGTTVAVLNQGSEDEKLIEGDELTIELNTICREYAGFISGAQAEISGYNPLFSGPPANVPGNISNGAIGFFAAYPASRTSIRVPGK